MTLFRRLICLMRISAALPPTFTISQVCSSAPVACAFTVTRAPSWICSMTSSLPRSQAQATVRALPLVVTDAPTSFLSRNLNEEGATSIGPSVVKYANPATWPLRGIPVGMRNLSELSDGPSSSLQSPSEQSPPHSPHSSLRSMPKMPSSDPGTWTAVPVQMVSSSILTVAVAVSPSLSRLTDTNPLSSASPHPALGSQSQLHAPTEFRYHSRTRQPLSRGYSYSTEYSSPSQYSPSPKP